MIAFSSESVSQLLPLLRKLRPLRVHIDVVPWLFELIGPRVTVHAVEGVTLLGLPPVCHSKVALTIKRMIDVLGSCAGLILFAPAHDLYRAAHSDMTRLAPSSSARPASVPACANSLRSSSAR